MYENPHFRYRRSIQDLQRDYTQGKESGDKDLMKPLEDVMRAWKGIQELPANDPNSFWVIAGYHGEPFRGAGWGNSSWWGGYCNHGNVLFPVWHRAYLLRLENAMRSIPGCKAVAQPFWDENAPLAPGEPAVPEAFTWDTFELDGATIPNPLKSYTFPKAIYDNLATDPDTQDYTKLLPYTTVRYPLSGLNSPVDASATTAHNGYYTDHNIDTVQVLNRNIAQWLTETIDIGKDANGNPIYVSSGVKSLYENCLKAPNYTVFSNVTSAGQWNEENFGITPVQDPKGTPVVVPLESPHNSIHLAVGGFDRPGFDADLPSGMAPIPDDIGANGDMGENDTASFDPIFHFHHCYVDRVFALWQQSHRCEDGTPCTQKLEIIDEYPGTNSVDSQGPTPGVAGGVWLTTQSPLTPFVMPSGAVYTAADLVDTEGQLNYAYGPCTLSDPIVPTGDSATTAAAPAAPPTLKVSGLNRAATPGSFLISVHVPVKEADGSFAKDEQGNVRKQLVGHEAVLSRWHVQGCANCMTHEDVRAFVPLHGLSHDEAQSAEIEVRVQTRTKALPGRSPVVRLTGTPAAGKAVSTESVPAEAVANHPVAKERVIAPAAPASGQGMVSLAVVQPSVVRQVVRLTVK